MRALAVVPLKPDSAAVVDIEEPTPGPGELLVDGLALGVCGTDREIAAGEYGWAPPGRERLVLGHESLGRVREAPADSGFEAGDLVVGVVRRPDPVPCGACARGEFDMCRNGEYTERGIKQIDGFGSERWTVEADYAMKLDPGLDQVGVLMEPTTIVAKAWDHIDRIGSRAYFAPERALVTGAGTIGLLAALLGVQRGLDVHVLDRVEEGIKPELVRGARRHLPHDRCRDDREGRPSGHRRRGDRRAAARLRRHAAQRQRRRRVPDRRLPDRPRHQHRRGPARPRHRARERRDLRLRQRQPGSLRARRPRRSRARSAAGSSG